jgi:transcription initiation factor IIF auxiliary subunit
MKNIWMKNKKTNETKIEKIFIFVFSDERKESIMKSVIYSLHWNKLNLLFKIISNI